MPLDLADFTGGLNERATPVGLADNESPDLLNMEVDPRVGFATRRGWERWNAEEIVPDPATWDPRFAKLHTLSTGQYRVYVTNDDGAIYRAEQDGVFSALTATGQAEPHVADFAPWGDEMWIARGMTQPSTLIDENDVEADLADAYLNFNDDYTNPSGTPSMPQCEYVEAHGGYMFVASTNEGGVLHPNRIRWSHPNQPGNYATLDFLDIDRGGGRITGLMSFGPRLLIFKTDSMWALYGYDLDSWQLEEVSTSIGLPHLGAVSRSEGAVFLFSRADLNGVYLYDGEGAPVHITERLAPEVEKIQDSDQVFVGWAAKRLWVATSRVTSVWEQIDEFERPGGDIYVWDPEVGDGAWTRFQSAAGSMGPIVARSDVSDRYPLAAMKGDSGASVLVRLEYRDDARDIVALPVEEQFTDEGDGFLLTDAADGFILTNGKDGRAPFRAYYRTGWKHAGWPERRKSWLRPRYIVGVPDESVLVRADVYWDYDESTVRRSSLGLFDRQGGVFWRALGAADPAGDGFDWNDGSLWGNAEEGSSLERATIGMGVNRAVSIRISGERATLGAAWSIDSIHLKLRLRRFTT